MNTKKLTLEEMKMKTHTYSWEMLVYTRIQKANMELKTNELDKILFETLLELPTFLDGVTPSRKTVFDIIFDNYLYGSKLNYQIYMMELEQRRINIFLPEYTDGADEVWKNPVSNIKKYIQRN